jgi:hypothetical protein
VKGIDHEQLTICQWIDLKRCEITEHSHGTLRQTKSLASKGNTMGHTNYWDRDAELPAKAFPAAVKDCKKIMKHLNIPLAGRDGTGRPIFRDDLIAFNGREPDGYETFAVGRIVAARGDKPKVFEFCKTNLRPYDLCVQAALIVLKHHLGEAITVSSDGEDTEWKRGREVCQKWLGYGEEFKLMK